MATHDEGTAVPTFDTPEPILAHIDLAADTVRVSAGERADTVVEIRPGDRHNEADVRAAEQTYVEYAAGRLVVRAGKERTGAGSGWGLSLGRLVESPADWARSLLHGPGSVEVSIHLPAGSRIDAKSVGTVVCRGPLDDVEVTTSYGDIRVEQAERLRVKSTYGDISVGRVHGHADVTNNHGGIQVDEIGGTAHVKTSHGDVRLGRVAGELRLSSAHGDITVDQALSGVAAKTAHAGLRIGEAVSGSIVMETSGGGLDLGIRPGTAAWLDVSSTYGTVHVSLDPGAAPDETDQVVEVRAHTDHGVITVHRS
ncbi:DUF4097 family beta strand repeat protein [Nonomuraea sp. NN258]|nr:DUF4097 family beta strand repeat protein [Nonomuraea antri]